MVKKPKMDNHHKEFLIGVMIFVLELLFFYYFWKNNILLTSAILLLSALTLMKFADKGEIFLYLTGFFLGPVFDIVLVPTGIWTYGNPYILSVPPWLWPSYGLGVIMIFKISKSLATFFKGKK